MKTIKNIISVMLLACLFITQACTDGFEDMNKDPKSPTATTLPALFNGVIETLQLGYSEQGAIHVGQYYAQSQQLGNARPNYPILGGADDVWGNYYFALKNILLLQQELEKATTTGNYDYTDAKACLNILWAYKTIRSVDYLGDMPFFNAGKGDKGPDYFFVAYDKQQDIYKYCIELLVSAGESITGGSNQYSFGTGDTFFNGDVTKWKKFANSLALRYSMQLADADGSTYTPIVGKILSDASKYPVITGTETVGLWPKQLGNWVVDSHPWLYRENNNSCMGTAMWNEMAINNNVDGSGIIDPRCFVFFEPNNNGEWKAYPQSPDDSTPVQDRGAYLTQAYPNGRNKAETQQEWDNKGAGCRYSPVNFYLATNDDFVPEIMITVAEVHFLTAEAYNRGIGVTKNATRAKSEYEAGIKASIRFWYDQVVTPCAMWKINKPSVTQEQIDNYMAKKAYSTDEATALKQIYAQLWIDSFRQPWIGFNLYRRTLATPRDTSGTYNPGDYNFHKVPYPESEKLYNYDNYLVAAGNDNSSATKLFWHK